MYIIKLLSCFVTAIAISHSAEYLAAIKELPSDSRREYHIIRQIGPECLAIVGDNQVSRLTAKRIAFSILDTNPRVKCYFLIANSAEHFPELPRYGRLLKRYDAFFLFQTTREHLEDVRGVPVRMERLRTIPVTFDDQESLNLPPARPALNPIIVQILKEISIDTLRGYVKKLQSFKTRHASTTENKTVVCPWLASILKPFCDSVYMQSVGSYGPNVVGVKYGKTTRSMEKYCLIGGHLDAVVKDGPFGAAGADDNATGTAGVLECARVFKNYSFENTIRFVLFNAEEVGLVGSEIMASDMKKKGHTVIGGVVTYDMLGHTVSNTKNIIQLEGFDNSAANKNFVTGYMQGIVDKYTQMKTYQYLHGFGSDHVSFNGEGYVSILLIEREWSHPAYHMDFDTLDCPVGLNDMQLFEGIVKSGTAAIADLAAPLTITNVSGEQAPEGFFTKACFDRIRGGMLRITVSNASDCAYGVEVYSAKGQFVRSMGPVRFNTVSTVSLPLSRESGPSMSNGVYFIRMVSENTRQTHPIVVF